MNKHLRSLFFKKRFQLRLTIAIPLIITLLVFSITLFNIAIAHRTLRATANSDGDNTVDYTRLVDSILFSQVFTLVYAGFIGLILGYAFVFPLRKFIQVYERIGKGDYTQDLALMQEKEVSEASNALNRMLSSLNKYILESISSGILTLDRDQRIVSVNSSAAAILGISPEEAVFGQLPKLIPQNAYNKKFYQIVEQALQQNQTGISLEAKVVTKDEREVYLGLTTSLLRSDDRTLLGVVLNFRDMDKLKEELKKKELNDKLTSLGRLATGIVHEIRNPLGSIKGLLSLIQEDLPEADKKREYLKVAMKELERLNIVASDLLFFIPQREKIKLFPVDINAVLDEAIALCKFEASDKEIEIVKEYAPIPRIEAEPLLLKQVFLNLIMNGCAAIESVGALRIATSLENNSVVIAVHDTGKGISFEDLGKIFEPFFTTKGGGIGLGLSVVSQIISVHKGRIEVQSHIGQGSTFTIHLPVRRHV